MIPKFEMFPLVKIRVKEAVETLYIYEFYQTKPNSGREDIGGRARARLNLRPVQKFVQYISHITS